MSSAGPTRDELFGKLNPSQRAAVDHGEDALLIIAGAGSGKTNTLANRVARLLLDGADPRRLLLLTFTRRAAQEMTRRARRIATAAGVPVRELSWSGTFHSAANRLLRLYAESVGLDPAFTVLDRADSGDLIDWVRSNKGLAKKARRFPRKGTCLAIYSRVVNAQESLADTLRRFFPWCEEWEPDLRALFSGFVEAKQSRNLLDYDDLLLYWLYLMREEQLAVDVRARFDHILVDEYQDTNAVQDEILHALAPSGRNLTVVGDDAQAIFSFRAATVRNILDFPGSFEKTARTVTLEQNYRSTQPILSAANAVISKSRERYSKELFSLRKSQEKPMLVTAEDENAEVEYVVETVLAQREAGIDLKDQAVLFRTAHHSDALEVELSRRNIPFVKYGGLKFLEAAHIKDVMAVLRWAENRRDSVAGFRVLKLLPGIGPSTARKALAMVAEVDSLRALADFSPPAAARESYAALVDLLLKLCETDRSWDGQLEQVTNWIGPIMAESYDHAAVREADLHQLEQIARQYPSRERFLTELTLDPPDITGDFAGPPHLDEDYLILSTIHSAKGQEWDTVFVLHAADGCIPSDMSTGDVEQIEERRLLYVAMTRAKNSLHVIHPLRFFVRHQPKHGDRAVQTPLTRFIPADIHPFFERTGFRLGVGGSDGKSASIATRVDVGARLRDMW